MPARDQDEEKRLRPTGVGPRATSACFFLINPVVPDIQDIPESHGFDFFAGPGNAFIPPKTPCSGQKLGCIIHHQIAAGLDQRGVKSDIRACGLETMVAVNIDDVEPVFGNLTLDISIR